MTLERNQTITLFDGFDELSEAHDHEAVGEGFVWEYSAPGSSRYAHRKLEPGFRCQSSQFITSARVVGCEPIRNRDRLVVEEYPTDLVTAVDDRAGEPESPFRRTRGEWCALNEQVESQTATEPNAPGG